MGEFALHRPDGAPLMVTNRRGRGMLAYLRLAPDHASGRERLAGLFWSDRGEAQARASLRQCLADLRGLLADAELDLLDIGRDRIALRAEAVCCDLSEVDEGLAKGAVEAVAAGLQAMGDARLLAGLEIGGLFRDWAEQERARIDQRIATGVRDLLERLQAAEEWASVRTLAEAYLPRDPLDEVVTAAAMRADAALGATASAHRRYEALKASLAREFGAVPGLAVKQALAAVREAPAAYEAGPERKPTPIELATAASFPLPSKPSIALLPFANLGEEDQGYFCDGMLEEISTVLSRFSSLFVIAGQSSLYYRGTSKTGPQIARELGVRYLLEGSVRRAAGRVRIAVKLVDAVAGEQVWAERFDDTLADVFALQERVARAVAGAIDSTMTDAEIRRAAVRRVHSTHAADLSWEAAAKLNAYDGPSVIEAATLAEQALALDEGYALAAGLAAFAHACIALNGWAADTGPHRLAARRLIELAIRIGSDDETVLALAAGAEMNVGGDIAAADRLVGQALEINPDKAYALFWGGWVDLQNGAPERALERLERSLRLNPRPHNRPWLLAGMGEALFLLRRYNEAAVVLGEVLRFTPDVPRTHALRAASLVMDGQIEKARANAAPVEAMGGIEAVMIYFANREQRKQLRAAFALLTPSAPSPAPGGRTV